MPARVPILLSYYALSNGVEAIIFGQVTSMHAADLTFTDYNRRRTFRTLLSLYRTRAVRDEIITIHFDSLSVDAKTDVTGFFLAKATVGQAKIILRKVTLSSGVAIKLLDGLYSLAIHHVDTPALVISDIDDTLLHSYISRKILKFRTLMFTPVEKRKAVKPMKVVIGSLVSNGATALYLSNSEQNLYPLIYRFLTLNDFPPGPIFLKQMRRMKHVIRYRKLPTPEAHKLAMLDIVIPMFPNKKFILVGDNTQYDLSIYLSTAKKYTGMVSDIFIRKVSNLRNEEVVIKDTKETLATLGINFYYAEEFSNVLNP